MSHPGMTFGGSAVCGTASTSPQPGGGGNSPPKARMAGGQPRNLNLSPLLAPSSEASRGRSDREGRDERPLAQGSAIFRCGVSEGRQRRFSGDANQVAEVQVLA